MSRRIRKVTSFIAVFIFTVSQIAWSSPSTPIDLAMSNQPTIEVTESEGSATEGESTQTTTDFLSESDSPLSALPEDSFIDRHALILLISLCSGSATRL